MAVPQHFAAADGGMHAHDISGGYGYNNQPPAMHGGYPGQAYHSADGTQAYTVDEYGRGTYWQLPAAPRLPAAAARGWHSQMQGGDHHSMQLYAPWAAAAAPLPPPHHPFATHMHAQAAQSQPQQHQHIEQQMMLRHHLAKLQQSQGHHNASYAPHHAQYDPAYPTQGGGGGSMSAMMATAPGNGWSQPPPPGGASHAYQPHHERHPTGQAQFGRPFDVGHQAAGGEGYTAYDPMRPHSMEQHAAQQYDPRAMHGDANRPRHSMDQQQQQQHSWPAHNYQQDPRYHDQARRDHAQQQHDWNWQQHHEHPSAYAPGYPAPHQGHAGQHANAAWQQQQNPKAHQGEWASHQEYHPGQQQQHMQAGNGQEGEVAAAAVAPSQPEKPAGPPSPDTLDKSCVPLSAFGAEIIWHACAVFSEPEILLEAYSDEETSPSSGSADSSPLLRTPLTSPHSPLSHGKWGDAPSSLMSSMELEPSATDSVKVCDVSPPSHAVRSFGPSMQSSPMQTSLASSNNPSPSDSHSRATKHPLAREGMSRTKSRERSRAAVLSVLGLVPPQLRWTLSHEKLPSLIEATGRSSAEAASRARGPARSGSPREAALGFGGAANGEVNPAFRRFAHQVMAQTLLSPAAFLLALLYALRVPLLAVDGSGNLDAEAQEVFASPPSAAPFKLLTLGLMIANKHLDDNTFLNKTWNEVTGIPLAELNRMEQFYLMRSNYEIALPEPTWLMFLCAVRQREQAKVAASHLVKLHESIGGGGGGDQQAHGPRRRSAASDEASRRVLLALDDISTALGGSIEPFALPPQSSEEDGSRTGSYWRHGHEGGEQVGGRAVRPTSALHHHHQHCQSAPVGTSDFKSSILGERDGNSAEPACWPRRPPFDALARSLSDPSKDGNEAGGGYARRPSSSTMTTHHHHHHEAPLAPSALLKLLNSGRTLASAH